MRKLAFASTALMLIALSAAMPADAAAPLKCINTIMTGPVPGDLEVPAGADCTLDGATVTGNVTVLGMLATENGAHISGNVTARHDDASLDLADCTVGGNVIADHAFNGRITMCAISGNVIIQHSSLMSDGGHPWMIMDSTVSGNLTLQNNMIGDPSGNPWMIMDSTVSGNLTLQNNMNVDVRISQNQIAGNLDCHNNTGHLDGRGNTVGGKTKGQCAGF